ncbi:hypothetical protein [Lysobacter gummosus]|uniref:hypothetical protein n=1 Tax=Lysobacter gummosus TaxID=262324 RepID=UPI003643E826
MLRVRSIFVFARHSREGGLRFTSEEPNIQRLRRAPPERHSRERGNPVPFVRERLKSLDSRFRGNDGLGDDAEVSGFPPSRE